VPLASRGFGWWLSPAHDATSRRISLAGAALVIVLYAACLFLFSNMA
jgi:hypothetical protein